MILIGKVADRHGWLGNMAPFPVEFQGQTYRTTEALFQCLRFDDEQIRSAIREQKSPMGAKMIAKKNRSAMVVEPMSEADLENMQMCLELKLDQHPILKARLCQSGDEWIVEDCTKRPNKSGLFWGAALIDKEWRGDNWLGILWMDLREKRC